MFLQIGIDEFPAEAAVGFAGACVAGQCPAIWRGGARHWKAVQEWSLDGLRSRFGDQRMRVRGSDQALDVFFGSATEQEMSFSDYLDKIIAPQTSGPRPYLGNFLINHPMMVPEVLGLLDDVAFPDFFPHLTDKQYRIWVAGSGQRSTIHNDNYENLNAQLFGTKSFLLIPPDDHHCLYAENVNEGLWSSPVNPQNPDLERHPRYAEARILGCTLKPGDILYIPRFWWHQAICDSLSINMNVWHFAGGDRDETWEQRVKKLK